MYIDADDFRKLQRLCNAFKQKLSTHMDALVDLDVFEDDDDELDTDFRNIITLINDMDKKKTNDMDEKKQTRTNLTDEYLTEKLVVLESTINTSTKYHPADVIDKIIEKVKSGEI